MSDDRTVTLRERARLTHACVSAGMSVRETIGVFRKVRAGHWEAQTNRDALAQAHYFRLLLGSKKGDAADTTEAG